jgi:hypothetical protein
MRRSRVDPSNGGRAKPRAEARNRVFPNGLNRWGLNRAGGGRRMERTNEKKGKLRKLGASIRTPARRMIDYVYVELSCGV